MYIILYYVVTHHYRNSNSVWINIKIVSFLIYKIYDLNIWGYYHLLDIFQNHPFILCESCAVDYTVKHRYDLLVEYQKYEINTTTDIGGKLHSGLQSNINIVDLN